MQVVERGGEVRVGERGRAVAQREAVGGGDGQLDVAARVAGGAPREGRVVRDRARAAGACGPATSKICRRASSSGIRIGILTSVRPERRMAASIRSTRFVMSMRSTLPRSELSPQKLKAERAHPLGDAGVARALVAAAALGLVRLVHDHHHRGQGPDGARRPSPGCARTGRRTSAAAAGSARRASRTPWRSTRRGSSCRCPGGPMRMMPMGAAEYRPRRMMSATSLQLARSRGRGRPPRRGRASAAGSRARRRTPGAAGRSCARRSAARASGCPRAARALHDVLDLHEGQAAGLRRQLLRRQLPADARRRARCRCRGEVGARPRGRAAAPPPPPRPTRPA